MKKLFSRCIALLLLIGAGGGTAYGAQIREQVFVVGADVDSTGAINQVQVDPAVNPGIANFLELAIKHWQFMPVQQNGKPVVVHTFIKAKLEVLPADSGKYTLRLSYVKHGPKWDERPPAYPPAAVRERSQGLFVLLGSMGRDGRFTVSETRSVATHRTRVTLGQAARKWLATLQAVPETVDGQAVPATARVFVNFRLEDFGVGMRPPVAHVAYSKEEQQLLLDAGFEPPFDHDEVRQPLVSSVLQTRTINPVTMHL